jgi:nitrogen regulatory protein PII
LLPRTLGPHVKKIEAVIPPSRVDLVRAELARRGLWGQLTLTDVLEGQINKSSTRNEDRTAVSLDSRIKMELIVADHQVDKAVEVILRHAVGDPSATEEEIGRDRSIIEVSVLVRNLISSAPLPFYGPISRLLSAPVINGDSRSG